MQLKQFFYKEIGAGGYSSQDGTVEFYGRVNALLHPDMRILDFGAGRGGWHSQNATYVTRLRTLRGKAHEVIACDIDKAVLKNNSADKVILTPADAPLPFPDSYFDMVVADWVLEHIENPRPTASELERIIRPGGWLCARTPNAYGIIALGARLIPNRFHKLMLRHMQPNRLPEDVFPTFYRLNTIGQLARHFATSKWTHHSYYYDGEPAYHFNSRFVHAALMLLNRLLPRFAWPYIFVFLQKRGSLPLPSPVHELD